MINAKWQNRLFDMAQLVATWSKDPSTKVGAIVFDAQRRVIGVGYNGFARGVIDLTDRYDEKMTKYKLVVHAEANAILNANKSVRECGIMSTKSPCSACMSLIIQSGLMAIYSPPPSTDGVWGEDAHFARQMALEADITWTTI